MSDKPILFSAPMVRALLAGTKTQTRRVLMPQPIAAPKALEGGNIPTAGLLYANDWVWPVSPGYNVVSNKSSAPDAFVKRHVRIKVGDRLYVREAWRINKVWDAVAPRDLGDVGPVTYEADGGMRYHTGKFRQAMHQPKRFSRLTLHVTAARVQRLQDISEADAKAEGVDEMTCYRPMNDTPNPPLVGPIWVLGYERLWNEINGAGSWGANPWVAAYTFEVERCNIAEARKP